MFDILIVDDHESEARLQWGPHILIACKYRIFVAGFTCIVWSATIALGQTTDGESQVDSQLPLSGEPLLNQSTILEEASIASSQLAAREVAPSLPSDDGITVSMFTAGNPILGLHSLGLRPTVSRRRQHLLRS